MKLNFIVATSHPDVQGNILDIHGIHIENPVKVLKEFDTNQPLGEAFISKDGEKLRAEFEMKEDFLLGTGLQPSIGFQVIRSETRQDGARVFKESKLLHVGICDSKNVDPNVPRI